MVNKYKPGSAAYRMVTEIVKVKQSSAVKDVIEIFSKSGKKFRMIDYIYVIDKKEKLVGVISVSEIFNNAKNALVSKIMKKKLISISPDAAEEKVAHLALKHSIKAIPVVKKGVLLGVVPAKAVISILNRSLQKNILHFAGIHKSHLEYENTMEVPLFLSIMHRIPWLIIGLLGIIVTAGLINIFRSVLEKYLILAFFVPAIVYISDALGTQHQTLFVRDLAILGKELKFTIYFLRQMFIAIIMGLILSGVTLLVVSLLWQEFFIGFIISASMFVALIVTSLTALVITLIMHKLGGDPALGSGPFATVISDVISIVIYFLIASWLI